LRPRRTDREITEAGELEEILTAAWFMRLGLCDGGEPYVIPMNFAWEQGRIYLHCASRGRKLDVISRCSRVCFQADVDSRVVPGDSPEDWTTHYRSVVGWGEARLVDDPGERLYALDLLMERHGGPPGPYSAGVLDRVTIIRIDIDRMTGKRSP
jgi:hypothetical protein